MIKDGHRNSECFFSQIQLKTMKTNIQIFQSPTFGSVRTMVNETGAPLFCLKDVCTALALDSKQVVRRLDKEVVSKHPLLTEGGKQMATFINEDGLYDVILDSRKAEARAFRKWVTSEVLPQIRMTGGYIPTKDAYGNRLSDEEIMMRADEIVGRTLRMLNEDAEDTLTATQVAKTFNMTVFDFNAVLQDMGIQYRSRGRWPQSPKVATPEWVRSPTHASACAS